MDQLFKQDSLFSSFMSRIGDFVILNVCFVISCLPLITIGPALVSLYYVAIKLYQKEELNIRESYIKSFKENLKSGFGMGLIMLFFALMFAFDAWIFIKSGIEFNGFIVMGVVVTFIIYSFIYVYLFPFMARYENKASSHIKNSLLISIKYFPKTLLLIGGHLLFLVATSLFVSLRPLLLVFGFSMLAYGHIAMVMNIFKALESEE